MNEKKTNHVSYRCYRIIRWLVQLFYPRITVEGAEQLPQDGCIIVGNHAQMNGPICAELYVPGTRTIWCAWQMMAIREVPAYAYQDFWSEKPKSVRWFYKLLSYIIAPLSSCVFNNAHTIPVYHDSRLVSTFKQTLAALDEGTGVVIFPECREPHNHIVNSFQDRFIDVAKLYYKRTGKAISFVPMYVAPKLKKLCFGAPIRFDPNAPISDERSRISAYLMDEITELAMALPIHKVVPYANLPSQLYHTNQPNEDSTI